MSHDRIEFISSYCDGWCERCAFTERCSAFAVRAAEAMCDDDIREAIELAVGRPRPVHPEAEAPEPEWLRDLPNEETTPAEQAEFDRAEEAHRKRLDASPIHIMASAIMMMTHAWLEAHREHLEAHHDHIVTEALNVVSWDRWLIGVKLRRALSGLDRDAPDHDIAEAIDDDPIQNDWNGSAKVALISICRSGDAWRTLAEATGDPAAAQLAQELSTLREEVEQVFPDAWKFRRPGFDAAG